MNLSKRFRTGAICLGLALSAGAASADVVVVVSQRSAITTLSKSQIADIFLGKARRFPNGLAAQPVDQKEGSTARDEFYLAFTGKSAAQVKSHWSKIIFTGRGQPAVAIESAVELKRRIAANPTAIGYIDRSMLDASVRQIR